MDPETTTPSFDSPMQIANDAPNDQPVPIAAAANPCCEQSVAVSAPTKAKVMFEQVELFELEPDEARDTEYLRKLLEPHYPAATDSKFEYRQEGDCLVVTMIKQNPPKG